MVHLVVEDSVVDFKLVDLLVQIPLPYIFGVRVQIVVQLVQAVVIPQLLDLVK